MRLETGPYSGEPEPNAAWVSALLGKLGFPAGLRGECIFALGRKGEATAQSRFPSWLYGD
jgi:hypothetical protein